MVTRKREIISKSLHIFLIVLFAASVVSRANAQVRFYADLSEQNISAGHIFQLQFIVEGASSAPTIGMPSLSRFTVHDSFESRTSTVSSDLKLVDVYSRVFAVSADRPGKYVIPSVKAVIDGKTFRSAPITVTISNKKVYARDSETIYELIPEQQLSLLAANDKPEDRIRKNLFLRATVNKSTCYTGEPLLITYKMYSRLLASSEVLKRPSLAGLSIVEMVDNYRGQAEIEYVDGVPYYSSLIRKVQGFPLQPGNLAMDIAEVSSTVHFVRKTAEPTSSSITRLPSDRVRFDYPVTLSSNRMSVMVKPLPTAKQPGNFLGAVGKFKLIVEASPKEIHPGDLVKIRVILQGQGNIPLLVPPSINWPKGVDTTEPAVKEEFDKTVFPLQGYKSFEYAFTAPDTGIYWIPATEYSFFNPATNGYEKTVSDSVKLTVTPGPAASREVVEQAIAESKTQKGPTQLYWFGVVVAAILFGIGYNIWAARAKKPAAVPAEVSMVANTPKKDLLVEASAALEGQQWQLFYRELESALWAAAAEAFQVLPSALNKRNVVNLFRLHAIDEDTTAAFDRLLQQCEWALYVPDPETQNAEAALENARRVIDKLQAGRVAI